MIARIIHFPLLLKSCATLRSVLAATSVVFLAGCATTWSASDRAQLTKVMVATPVVAKGAGEKPDATESPRMASAIPMVTGGGLIPALIGSAIDASVTSKQQRKYEAANAELFPALAKAMGPPPIIQVKQAIKRRLAFHSFFGSRLADKSRVSFVTEIQKYGLQRVPGYKGQEIPFRVRIIAHITLKLPDGNSLWDGQFIATSSKARTAEEILADPDFVENSIDEASHDLCVQVTARLDEKLKKKS